MFQFRFCIVDWCGRQKLKCLSISHMQLNSVGNISYAKPPQRKKGLDSAGNAFVIKLVVRALVIKWLVGKLRLLFDWF